MFTLATVTLSPSSLEISSNAGAIILQGPHHSAQKSTTTGLSDFSTSSSKDAARADFVRARRLGATSFPTLLFTGSDGSVVKFGYPTSTAADHTRDQIGRTSCRE